MSKRRNKNRQQKQKKMRAGQKNNLNKPLSKDAAQEKYNELIKLLTEYDSYRKKKEPLWVYADKRYKVDLEKVRKVGRDWGANAHTPLDHGLVLTALADVISANSGVFYTYENEEARYLSVLLNLCYDREYNESKGALEDYKMELDALNKGTGIKWLYRLYEEYPRKYPKTFDELTGEGTYDEVKQVKEQLVGKWVDLFDFWPNPMFGEFEEMPDCFLRVRFGKDKAKALFGQYAGWKNATAGEWINFAGKSASEKDKESGTQDKKSWYEFLYYWNQDTDEYFILGSKGIVYSGPNPYFHKTLPFSKRVWIHVNGDFYGLGIPHQVKPQVEMIQTIRNIRIDNANLRNSNIMKALKSVQLTDEELKAKPNLIIRVDDMGDIEPLAVPDVSLSSYKDEQGLMEDAKWSSGIDNRLVGVGSGGTATETAALQQSAMKRLKLHIQYCNENTLMREGQIMKELIKQFYSQPEKVVEINGSDNTVKLVEREREFILKRQKVNYLLNGTNPNKVEGFSIEPSATDGVLKIMTGMFDMSGKSILVKADSKINISQWSQRQDAQDLFKLLGADPLVDPIKVREMLIEAYGKNPDEIMGQPPQGGPSGNVKETMNFKDLPPEGQQQMAAQAGIQLNGGGTPQDQGAPAPDANGGDQNASPAPQNPAQAAPSAQAPANGQPMNPQDLDQDAVKNIVVIMHGQQPELVKQPTHEFLMSLLYIYKLLKTQNKIPSPAIETAIKNYIMYEMKLGGGGMAPGAQDNQAQGPSDNSNMAMQYSLPGRNTGQMGGQM